VCLSKVYRSDKDDENPVLEDVSSLKVRGTELVFSTILGEEHIIKGNIEKINFSESKIVLETE